MVVIVKEKYLIQPCRSCLDSSRAVSSEFLRPVLRKSTSKSTKKCFGCVFAISDACRQIAFHEIPSLGKIKALFCDFFLSKVYFNSALCYNVLWKIPRGKHEVLMNKNSICTCFAAAMKTFGVFLYVSFVSKQNRICHRLVWFFARETL